MNELSFGDEILTVQTGPLANQVCLHFWNYEAYFPNTDSSCENSCDLTPIRQHVLCDDRFQIMTPRTLALDLSSSIDYGFQFEGSDVEAQSACPLWDGAIHSVFRSNLPTSFINSEVCCQWTTCFPTPIRRLWRDNDMICTLPCLVNSSTSMANKTDETPSLCFAQGLEFLRSGTPFAEDVDNRLRRLLERCNRPSALQLFTEAETGFVGFHLPLIDWWLDEFPKRPIITLALFDSSKTIGTDYRIQRISQAHQLILAAVMESPDAGLTHATWVPLDLTAIGGPKQPDCVRSSIMAAGISCLTTPLRLRPTEGGLSPDSWIAFSQTGHSRRMLTARFGFAEACAENTNLQWCTVNPFYRRHVENSSPSLWREACLRGVELHPTGDKILQFAASVRGTQRVPDMNENFHLSDKVSEYPHLEPGTRASLLPQLATRPVHLSLDVTSLAHCNQPVGIRVASFLDSPGTRSVESQQLQNLVHFFKSNRSRPPIDGLEPDQWAEFVETGQRYLVDAYQAS